MRAPCPAALLWIASCTAAFAWGQEGHSIVGEIAHRRLGPEARATVERLLGPGHSLASVASWADDVRDARPKTYNWHFVDIPLGADRYDPARHCKPDEEKGDCVVAEIERARRDLACGASDEVKAEALKFLVHFVGDIHQPLHTVADAGGGNYIKVDLFMHGFTCKGVCTPHHDSMKLHEAWDSGLIMKVVWAWGAYVDRLEGGFLRTPDARGIDGGTPADWAWESHLTGKQVWDAVPADKVLTEDYFRMAVPILDRQLGAAGLRLARLLNETAGAPMCQRP